MNTITISSKYRLVIPKKAREALNIQIGQKMTVVAYCDRIVLIPFHPMQQARGSLK